MKNKQNKFKITFLGIILSYLLVVMPVSASTFVVSKEYVNVSEGDIVQVIIYASSSSTDYTFKSSINFSSDVLSFSDWQWEDNWIPLSVDDYDLVDNTSGKIIKTSGYPSGVSGEKEFGIVTFVAKKSGQATISFDDNSFILDENGNDTYR